MPEEGAMPEVVWVGRGDWLDGWAEWAKFVGWDGVESWTGTVSAAHGGPRRLEGGGFIPSSYGRIMLSTKDL
jgi:hypothetical protein